MSTPSTQPESCLVAERAGFRWYHVEDVKGPALDELAAAFGLHELAIEDCRTARTRAKFEEYENHIFVVVNTLHFDPEKYECWFGQLDVFAGKDFLISVHDGPSRTFRAVHPRFKVDPRLAQTGRLLHALLDYIVDQYLPVLDSIEGRIEELEQKAYAEPSPKLLAQIFELKRALIEFRRVATSMRDTINYIVHRSEPWLRQQQAYFRDVYDHVVRAMDFVETYRDILTGVLDVHLTATTNRTNEIMKVLTIYATIGLPLLLITGYFGMNFPDLPLLHHPNGVQYMHWAMIVMSLLLLWIFKRRHWF
jgi:magnesium transporter